MCPLRFILVFLSAALAGYFAWTSVRSSQESGLMMVSDHSAHKPTREKQGLSYVKMMQNGFWVFIDMASGRHLWRHLKEMKKGHTTNEEAKKERVESS
nr:uncharacterized protein LOC113696961 [Coffea arabica]